VWPVTLRRVERRTGVSTVSVPSSSLSLRVMEPRCDQRPTRCHGIARKKTRGVGASWE
jgi:hypothetical protein